MSSTAARSARALGRRVSQYLQTAPGLNEEDAEMEQQQPSPTFNAATARPQPAVATGQPQPSLAPLGDGYVPLEGGVTVNPDTVFATAHTDVAAGSGTGISGAQHDTMLRSQPHTLIAPRSGIGAGGSGTPQLGPTPDPRAQPTAQLIMPVSGIGAQVAAPPQPQPIADDLQSALRALTQMVLNNEARNAAMQAQLTALAQQLQAQPHSVQPVPATVQPPAGPPAAAAVAIQQTPAVPHVQPTSAARVASEQPMIQPAPIAHSVPAAAAVLQPAPFVPPVPVPPAHPVQPVVPPAPPAPVVAPVSQPVQLRHPGAVLEGQASHDPVPDQPAAAPAVAHLQRHSEAGVVQPPAPAAAADAEIARALAVIRAAGVHVADQPALHPLTTVQPQPGVGLAQPVHPVVPPQQPPPPVAPAAAPAAPAYAGHSQPIPTAVPPVPQQYQPQPAPAAVPTPQPQPEPAMAPTRATTVTAPVQHVAPPVLPVGLEWGKKPLGNPFALMEGNPRMQLDGSSGLKYNDWKRIVKDRAVSIKTGEKQAYTHPNMCLSYTFLVHYLYTSAFVKNSHAHGLATDALSDLGGTGWPVGPGICGHGART